MRLISAELFQIESLTPGEGKAMAVYACDKWLKHGALPAGAFDMRTEVIAKLGIAE